MRSGDVKLLLSSLKYLFLPCLFMLALKQEVTGVLQTSHLSVWEIQDRPFGVFLTVWSQTAWRRAISFLHFVHAEIKMCLCLKFNSIICKANEVSRCSSFSGKLNISSTTPTPFQGSLGILTRGCCWEFQDGQGYFNFWKSPLVKSVSWWQPVPWIQMASPSWKWPPGSLGTFEGGSEMYFPGKLPSLMMSSAFNGTTLWPQDFSHCLVISKGMGGFYLWKIPAIQLIGKAIIMSITMISLSYHPVNGGNSRTLRTIECDLTRLLPFATCSLRTTQAKTAWNSHIFLCGKGKNREKS